MTTENSLDDQKAKEKMTKYQQIVTDLSDDIKKLQEATKIFQTTVSKKFAAVPNNKELKEINQTISQLENYFKENSAKIRNSLEKMKEDYQEMIRKNPNSRNLLCCEFMEIHWRGLTNTFANACCEFRNVQVFYRNQEERAQLIVLKNKYPNLNDDQLKQKMLNEDDESLHFDMSLSSKRLQNAKEKRKKIQDIVKSINDLCDLIDQLHKMVEEGGKAIDRIEVKMDVAVTETQQANRNLRSALRYQLRATRIKRIFYIILIVLGFCFLLFVGFKLYSFRGKGSPSSNLAPPQQPLT
ncbi:hypothetical protein EDEG_03457 [Edhazardia aedis USNM 41457]|uniref:t-SNARE coiled-coil homology domain-containing protein n=1 Tax=Edhazardia aedis (strain USNM 41457) TaxID=1003232 RepID=J9DL67_EDHAE|nr:hypothetical protein EDEG_03457 [Edhazardia aedis USNM 41457]|eukprot:EJW02097.1 hypothetical protein EDEG_03457 [Edhazardia aedis USNM 41457]